VIFAPLTEGNPAYFSVASDASNKGTTKCFQCELDISLCLMLCSSSYLPFKKTAMKLKMALPICLEKHELDIRHTTSQPLQQIMPLYVFGANHCVGQLLSSANKSHSKTQGKKQNLKETKLFIKDVQNEDAICIGFLFSKTKQNVTLKLFTRYCETGVKKLCVINSISITNVIGLLQ